MKKRSPIAVFLLPFITFGIYSLYWQVKTKGEMNKLGATIPTAWLYIIPIVNIWWLWKYSEGVDHVTGSKLSTVLAFILLLLLGTIGQAVVQASFNSDVVAASPAVNNGAFNPVQGGAVPPTPQPSGMPAEPVSQPATNPEPPVPPTVQPPSNPVG